MGSEEHRSSALKSKSVLVTAKARVAILVTGIMAIGLVMWFTTNSDQPTGAEPVDPTTSPNPTYGSVAQICGSMDEDLYHDVVGLDAHQGPGGGGTTGLSSEMGCTWTSSDGEGDLRDYTLGISAKQFVEPDEALREFDAALRDAGVDRDATTPLDGDWKQGLSYNTGDETTNKLHVLIQDDNLELSIWQEIEPSDAIDTDKALDFATTIAHNILTDLATRNP